MVVQGLGSHYKVFRNGDENVDYGGLSYICRARKVSQAAKRPCSAMYLDVENVVKEIRLGIAIG
jgi:hypothetical protein